MEQNKDQQKNKVILAALLIGLAVMIGLIIWGVYKNHKFEISQNIYFTEYEPERGKEDTIIYKYDPISDKVFEIGRVSDWFCQCIINKDETRITGFVREAPGQGIIDIVEYDIKTGTITSKNVMEKIDELTMGASWKAMLYDEGNKMLFKYRIEEERVAKLLSYDFATGEFESVNGIREAKEAIGSLSLIDEQAIWSFVGYTIFYDNGEYWPIMTELRNSTHCSAISLSIGQIAYLNNDMSHKEIYLYDIKLRKSSCIASKSWNTYYDDFDFINAMWSKDGRQFFYVKSFPGLFQEADTSLMIYNVRSGKHKRIYKVKATYHQFQYISNS